MRKEDKGKIIEQLAATVKEFPHFYLVDTTAMNAATTSAFRRECFKAQDRGVQNAQRTDHDQRAELPFRQPV